MNDLIEFLRARLDEDEHIARRILSFSRDSYHRAPPEKWIADRRVNNAEPPYFDYRVVRTERAGTPEVDLIRLDLDYGSHLSEHVARFGSPARVLAEVAAKRRIMAEHESYSDYGETCQTCHRWDDLTGDPWPCSTLRLLALPYAGHPDYRQEWKP